MPDLSKPGRRLTPEEQLAAFEAELEIFAPREDEVAVEYFNPPAPPPPPEEDAAPQSARPDPVSRWEGVDTAHHALSVADQAHARIEAIAAAGGGDRALVLIGAFARLLREDEVTVEIDGEATTLTMKDLEALAPKPEEGGA